MARSDHWETVRFECTGCGDCCTGAQTDLEVNASERRVLREFLDIGDAEFARRYLVPVVGGGDGIGTDAEGRCAFLDADTRRCTVYEARPRQCRTFPFWPELLRTEASWRRAARQCEGIGRGAVVPLERLAEAFADTDT